MDIVRCFKDAWRLLIKDPGPLLVTTVVSSFVVGGIVGVLTFAAFDVLPWLGESPDGSSPYAGPNDRVVVVVGMAVLVIVAVLFQAWAYAAILKMILRRVREGRPARFGDMKPRLEGLASFVVAVAALDAFAAAVGVLGFHAFWDPLAGFGAVALVILGSVLWTIWCYTPVVIADKRRGLRESVSESRVLSKRRGYGSTFLTLFVAAMAGGVASIFAFVVPGLGQVFPVLLTVYFLAYLVVMYLQATGEFALVDEALHRLAGPAGPGASEHYPPSARPSASGSPLAGTSGAPLAAPQATMGPRSAAAEVTEPVAPRAPQMAVAGFVCGVGAVCFSIIPFLGLVLTPIPAILGVVFGAIGLSQAQRRGAPKRLAIAGITCGLAAPLVFVALYIGFGGWA